MPFAGKRFARLDRRQRDHLPVVDRRTGPRLPHEAVAIACQFPLDDGDEREQGRHEDGHEQTDGQAVERHVHLFDAHGHS